MNILFGFEYITHVTKCIYTVIVSTVLTNYYKVSKVSLIINSWTPKKIQCMIFDVMLYHHGLNIQKTARVEIMDLDFFIANI